MNRVTDDLGFDPVLREVADKIKKLMSEADVAGVVILHKKGDPSSFLEYRINISPSYSAAQMDGLKLKVTAPIVDPAAPDAHLQKAVDTINMFANLEQLCHKVLQSLGQSRIYVIQQLGIKPKGGPPPMNGKNLKR